MERGGQRCCRLIRWLPKKIEQDCYVITSPAMYTRAFLQGLSAQRKRERADQLIHVHVETVKELAAQEKTSYMFEPDNIRHNPRQHPNTPVLTTEDFVAAFQRKFPDCTVSYQEAWVDVDVTNRVLKRGIVIDWS
jgi:hypothetical protein